MTRGIVCALFVLALCAGVLGQSGTDVTVRLSGDFGILGDPAPSTTADIIGIESGTVYMLKFYDGGPSLPLGGWYTACGITFEGFPFFGSSVDITGPLFVVGDTTDNSVGIYYIDGFVDDTNDDGDSDAAKAAGYDASLWVPATSTEAIRLGVTTSVRQAFMNGTYEYEGYGYGYNYGISYDYDYDYEEGYDEGYDSYNEGYDFPFEDYYSDDYFPADYGYWEPYGGYAGTDGENYGFGEDDGPGFDYGGGGGYDSDFRDGPPPAYADYAPGFYYWNYAIPESWLFEIIEDTPQTDALICGYHNETTGEGRRFYIKTIEFVLNDGDLNWVENTTATELLGCGLCKFGSRLTVGEQFIASTCNMPCKQNRVATEDGGLAVVPGAVACTMVCVLPLGTMNDNRGYRLALPSYLKPFKVLESQVNRFYTALDAYSTFMVNAGCFLEQKATGFNQNIGGFSPMIQLCKMNPRGRVLEKSCDRGPVLVLQDEKLNVCPTSVALYGENKVAKFIALGFSNLETVYLFKMNNSLPFTSQFLRTYQKITLDETQKTSLFGHSVSFSTDDSTFEGTDDSVSAPSRVTLAIGAFGDVNEGAGATFVYSEIQEGERPPEDCPTENDNCFFQQTPGTMSSYNYPVRYDFGFATEMDYNSVAIVTVDIASGFWEFSSYTECDLGEQWIGDQCVPCPAGQYSNTESYDPCRLCPEGTFQPRRGQVSPGACIPCNRAEFCPMGAKVPIDQRYADDELYAINDPDPKASPALHFETTFFFSVVPPALILGAILIIFFLPFAISCLYRFKIFRSFRSFVCLFNLIDDKENDLLSAFFTVWLIISTVFLVVFAILFATKVNDSLTTSLKTFDDVTDLESASDLTIIDEVPFQVSIAYINLADYISCDDKSFDLTIDGCFDDYERCDPLVHYKQSRIGETEARVCNVTFGFREKTQLDRFSRFTLTTKVDRFYASQVWYKVSTLNDDDTDIEGNSYVSGSVQPLPDAVLRGEGKASVLSTLTPLMNCRSNTLNWITFLLVTSESECEFDTQGSLKSFSHLANVTQDASEPDFYVPNREFPNLEGYAFTVEIEKGNYYHLKAQGNYVTNAQIFILVVLLIFGFWWGVLQLTKFIIDRCIYISKTSCETVA